jgi:tetratricopeptide (TPR) repeat protein
MSSSKEGWETKVEELKALGNKAFLANDFTSAISLYTQALSSFPSSPSPSTSLSKPQKETKGILFCNRGFCFLKKSPAVAADYDQALVDCQAALQLHPSYIKAVFRKALAHEGRAKTRGTASKILVLRFFLLIYPIPPSVSPLWSRLSLSFPFLMHLSFSALYFFLDRSS